MRISDRGIELIKSFESYRSHPYYDSARVPTIGYGTTYYQDGRRVRISDAPVTEAQATELLLANLGRYERAIEDALRVDVTQNQFDALVCWAFNVGVSAAQNSTLMRKLNSGDYLGAADQFLRWNKAGGVVLNGLSRRRAAEREMFLS